MRLQWLLLWLWQWQLLWLWLWLLLPSCDGPCEVTPLCLYLMARGLLSGPT